MTPFKRAFKVGLHSIEILMHHFLAQDIKSITMKQVVFGSFWSTATAWRTVNDVFLKRGDD